MSQIHAMLSHKDSPLLFITLTFKLLHKLVLMDYRKALPVLTQLDYWTFLVELVNVKQMRDLENHENRQCLVVLKKSLLRV